MAEDENKSEGKSESGDAPLAEPVAPKPQKAAPPPPAPAPAPQYYQKPPFEPSSIASNKLLLVFIILGIILMLVGSMLISIVPTIGDVDEDDPDDLVSQAESKINTNAAGEIIFNIGGFLLALFLLFAGCFRPDMNQFARLGMLIAAALIITNFIVF
jgi:uncharacterized BrkB/YihY/UPF0761 family membrane protein